MTSADPTVDNPSIHTVWEGPTAGTNSAAATAIETHLATVFGSVATGALDALDAYISPVISRGDHDTTYEFYDITGHLGGTPAGAPVAVITAGMISANTGTPLPEGCAAALSFRSNYGTDVEFGTGTRPRARDRNRFFWGPLNASAIHAQPTTNRCAFTDQFVTDCLKTLVALSATVHASDGDWDLRVWSRVDAAVKLPTVGFMDNRVDYQRRRSDPAPATRLSIALASA